MFYYHHLEKRMKKIDLQAILCDDKEGLLGLTQKWKSEGCSIVFTNGCFDILHAGHVDYLEKAALEGDRLIVGLNSDDSVTRLKGEDRPYNSVDRRIKVLSALRSIDAIVVFSEDTSIKLITSILPDVLVKGGDYSNKLVVGADVVQNNGGKLELIDFIHRVSTSSILEKMKKKSHD